MVEASKEKIIVTGAGGLLGSALCKYFKGKNEVIGLTHQDCDISNRNQVEQKIIRQNPDIIINPAGLTRVDQCERDAALSKQANVDGVRNLFLACKKLNCLMIHVSSDYVFDGEKEGTYLETDLPRPLSIYSQHKLESEKIVKDTLSKYFIVRTSWLFGKIDKDFVGVVINRIKSKAPLKIVNDKFSIPTYGLDLAKAISDLASRVSDYGVYHITNSGGCSWYDFAKEIAKIYLGKELDIEAISIKDLGLLAERPRNSILDNTKFYKAVGYRLRPWQEALKEYIDLAYG